MVRAGTGAGDRGGAGCAAGGLVRAKSGGRATGRTIGSIQRFGQHAAYRCRLRGDPLPGHAGSLRGIARRGILPGTPAIRGSHPDGEIGRHGRWAFQRSVRVADFPADGRGLFGLRLAGFAGREQDERPGLRHQARRVDDHAARGLARAGRGYGVPDLRRHPRGEREGAAEQQHPGADGRHGEYPAGPRRGRAGGAREGQRLQDRGGDSGEPRWRPSR